MKPVNLLPAEAAVVSASAGKPNYGMIGGAAVGLVAVVVVAGYFAFARVDSVKSETTASNDRATKATQETASVRSQIETLGQPVVDGDKQLAQGKEQVLVSAYTERYDFVLLASELRGVMEGTGGWYESIEATSSSTSDSGGSKGFKVVGYMPNEKLAASFNERLKGTKSLKDATLSGLDSEVLTSLQTKKPGRYWKFTIEATMVDTVAPSADGGVNGDATGTTVSAGGADSGTIELSLDAEPPKPKPKAAKPKAPAKPKNPFDVAASAAITGGGA